MYDLENGQPQELSTTVVSAAAPVASSQNGTAELKKAHTDAPTEETSTSQAGGASSSVNQFLRDFWTKVKGGDEKPLKPVDLQTAVISFFGAFISILIIACIDQYASPKEGFDVPYLIASFGASAVLVFGLPAAPLSQPRNLIGGHCFSALTGIIVRLIIQPQYGGGKANFVSTALGMALSLTVMQLTGTTHPPAGATGLIAAAADPIPDWHGFKYLLTAFLGSVTMMLVALVFNNLVPKRKYPAFW